MLRCLNKTLQLGLIIVITFIFLQILLKLILSVIVLNDYIRLSKMQEKGSHQKYVHFVSANISTLIFAFIDYCYRN